MDSYTISGPLLRALITALNEMPAGRVRPLLNNLDAEITRQEEQRRTEARDALVASLRVDGQRRSPQEVESG